MEVKVKVLEKRHPYEAPKADFVVLESQGVLCSSVADTMGMSNNGTSVTVDLFAL